MPYWLDPANAWAAIPLQVLGFGLAIWQIRKAKGAAESAERAATSASERLGSNLLLVILPQLNQVETNLEWAIAKSDRDAAIHYLGSWRWQAGQTRGLLNSGSTMADDAVLSLIQASITAAADAKLALQDPSADVRKRCRAVQKAIAAVTGTVGELSATQSLEGKVSNDQ